MPLDLVTLRGKDEITAFIVESCCLWMQSQSNRLQVSLTPCRVQRRADKELEAEASLQHRLHC